MCRDRRGIVTPWLSGIARNVCRRRIHRQARDAEKIDRFLIFEAHIPNRSSRDPGETRSLEQDELTTLLDHALGLLPAPTRDALVQHHIDERSRGESAGTLSMSEGTVAVHLYRGTLALKQMLAKPGMSDIARPALSARGAPDHAWSTGPSSGDILTSGRAPPTIASNN